MALYVIRFGIEGWLRTYFAEGRLLDPTQKDRFTASFYFWWQLGGFTGTVLSGPISDSLTSGRRMPMAAACALVLAMQVRQLRTAATSTSVSLVGLLAGFAVFSQRTLFSLFSRQQVPNNSGGRAEAICNMLAEAGGALAGYPLIQLVTRSSSSWDVYVLVLTGCAAWLSAGNLAILAFAEAWGGGRGFAGSGSKVASAARFPPRLRLPLPPLPPPPSVCTPRRSVTATTWEGDGRAQKQIDAATEEEARCDATLKAPKGAAGTTSGRTQTPRNRRRKRKNNKDA